MTSQQPGKPDTVKLPAARGLPVTRKFSSSRKSAEVVRSLLRAHGVTA